MNRYLLSSTGLDPELRKETIRAIQSLSHDELMNTVVIPLFESRGFKVDSRHRRQERKHGLDVLLILNPETDDEFVCGVQVKTSREKLTGKLSALWACARKAFGFHQYWKVGPKRQLSKFYWITSELISKPIWDEFREQLEGNTDYAKEFGGRTELWDIETLVGKHGEEDCLDVLRSVQAVH